MSTLSLRLPNSLHEEVKSLARKEGVSINQFISSAVAEKMSALLTESYLNDRSQRGNKRSFLEAMEKVPDVDPEDNDRLWIGQTRKPDTTLKTSVSGSSLERSYSG